MSPATKHNNAHRKGDRPTLPSVKCGDLTRRIGLSLTGLFVPLRLSRYAAHEASTLLPLLPLMTKGEQPKQTHKRLQIVVAIKMSFDGTQCLLLADRHLLPLPRYRRVCRPVCVVSAHGGPSAPLKLVVKCMRSTLPVQTRLTGLIHL